MLIGVIADTHGLIRPEALQALAGVELILHAGDVGGPTIIAALEKVAPVRAVQGNTDPVDFPAPERLNLTLEGVRLHVSHGHELGSPTPEKLLARYPADVIIYGHTHKAVVYASGARLVLNPGAAGPKRFDLLPSVARLTLQSGHAAAEIVSLRV
jgi:putative phosphoesterase